MNQQQAIRLSTNILKIGSMEMKVVDLADCLKGLRSTSRIATE
jgi:hypothetical protein